MPVDNLDGGTVGVSYFGDKDLKSPVIVSPDAGGVYRAKKFREVLSTKFDTDAGLAMIVKQRAKANEVSSMDLVGSVADSDCIIVDDMIDKSGSWIAAAETVVKRGGARRVYCIATHALFGADSLDQMEACPSIDYIVVTNTFPISPAIIRRSKKLIVIDVSSLLAESIRRHHYGERFVSSGFSCMQKRSYH